MGTTFAIRCKECSEILDLELKDLREKADAQSYSFTADCGKCGAVTQYSNLSVDDFEKLMDIGISEEDRIIQYLGISKESYRRHAIPEAITFIDMVICLPDSDVKEILRRSLKIPPVRFKDNWWLIATPSQRLQVIYDQIRDQLAVVFNKGAPIDCAGMPGVVAFIQGLSAQSTGSFLSRIRNWFQRPKHGA